MAIVMPDWGLEKATRLRRDALIVIWRDPSAKDLLAARLAGRYGHRELCEILANWVFSPRVPVEFNPKPSAYTAAAAFIKEMIGAGVLIRDSTGRSEKYRFSAEAWAIWTAAGEAAYLLGG